MRKLKAIWQLTRLEHGLMLMVAVLIGGIISIQRSVEEILKYDIIYASLTALLLEASTFSLNDYLDLEIDKKNLRIDRPLVRGDLDPKIALLIFSLLFPAGIAFSFLVNIKCFYIALLTGFLAVLYDMRLKKVKYIGNFYIAYTTAIPFFFGALAVSEHIPCAIIVLSLIAFIASLGREIMKDIMDMSGDKIEGVKSIPMYLGRRATSYLIAFIYILSISLSFIPYGMLEGTTFYHNLFYLAPVLITDTMFLYLSVGLITREDPPIRSYRKVSLVAMMIGLVAFLLGSLVR